MGFITPDPYFNEPNFITPTEAVPRERKPQSGGQMVSDAFLLNNDVVNVYRKLFSEQYPVDPDHNPAEFIKGTHYDRNYRDNFVGSTSEQDTRARMRRIDEEEAAKARSAESGPMGTVLDLGAGVLSPTVFLPAGQIVRSARGGYSALKSALSVGVAGGLQTAAQEAILQGTQETRTLHESLINVGSGTLLAGILGAGGSKLLQHFETRQAEAAVARARLQVDAHNGVDILNTPPTEGFDVFHGSPHDFEAFDISKIGGRGGGEARGVGFNFADNAADTQLYRHPFMNVGGSDLGPEYKVRVHADRAQLLDWEKPLTDQPKAVQELVGKFNLAQKVEGKYGSHIYDALYNRIFSDITDNIAAKKGIDVLAIDEADQAAARLATLRGLVDAGIPGITHEARGEVPKGAVIFDDKLLTIIEKNGEKIDVRPFTPEATPAGGASSIGAAATDARQLDMFAAYPGMNTPGRSVSPTRTLLNSSSTDTRRIAADLASAPYRFKENVEGVATSQGPPVDIQQRMAIDGTEYEIGQALKGHYSDYFFGEQRKAPVLQSRYQRMTGASDKMSYDEFKAEVGKAWMNNGTHELPQASAAAQAIMQKVEEWAKRADVSIEGFKRGEQATGEAYFPHLWNKKLIQGQKPEFINWLTGIYKNDQITKQGAQGRIGAYHGALTSHTDNIEKLTGKIAKLNEDVDVIAARAEETTRINKFANQRATTLREASLYTPEPPPEKIAGAAVRTDKGVFKGVTHATAASLAQDAGVDISKLNLDDIDGFVTSTGRYVGREEAGTIADAAEQRSVKGGRLESSVVDYRKGDYEALTRDEAMQLPEGRRPKFPDAPFYKVGRAGTDVEGHLAGYGSLKEAREAAGLGAIESLPTSAQLNKAKGGAVFETKVRNRGNELADRASGKLAAIDELEQKLAKEIANHDEMRAKIEGELGKWEGTSATEAKSAMKARAKAEADRIARAAAKSEEPPTKRLTSADDAVDMAVKRIMESDRTRADAELRSRASETTDRIIGSPDGRLPYDEHMGGPQIGKTSAVPNRGALANRRLDVTNAQAAPWIEQDAEHVLASYMRTVVPDVLLSEKFGDPEMTVAFKQINESYNHLIDQTKPGKARDALTKEHENSVKVMAAIRDRLRGVYGWSENTSNMAKVAQSVKVLNNISDLGSSAIASLSDFAGPLFRWGVTAAIRDGWAPFFQAISAKGEEGKQFTNQMRAIGIGIDVATNARQHSMDEITGAYKPGSPIERTLQTVNDKFFIANGLAHLTDMQKMIAAHAAVHEVINISRRVSEGKATAREIGNLAEGGIDGNMAGRIWREFNNPGAGEIVGKVYLPNTSTWTDRGAADAFNGAIYREVNIAVVSPGQEKPLFLSRPVGSLLGQFKTFTAAANERILIANLQRRDAQSLSGVVAAIGLGMLSYKINALTGGQPTSDKPADWFREGVSRSGMLGWLEEGNAALAKGTGGKMDAYRLAGSDKPLTRYAGRNTLDMVLGPTVGKARDLLSAPGPLFRGDWSASDTHQIRRLMPFENMFYLRGLFNKVEETTNSHFNIPERRETVH